MNLKTELTARFAEISDHMQAFSLLKKIKQGPSENVQLFAERLLALARDAFQGQDGNNVAVERQLIFFCRQPSSRLSQNEGHAGQPGQFSACYPGGS